jgi:glycosyltransferase involved in cell wall biosynthesis
MYKSRRIAVVIPSYNEARHIAQVIRSIPDFASNLIVVDDCSRDDTFAIAARIAAANADNRVIVLQTGRNGGVGCAMVHGYRKALELSADIIVKMDGDGQMPPEYLPALLDAIIEGGYDYAKGNRFLAAQSLAEMPRHRLLGNIVLTFMTKLASGYWHVFDPQNGYTAITGEALRTLDLAQLHPRYFFENDMLMQLSLRNLRVKDVATPARYGEELSHLNPFQVSVTFPLLFLRRFLRRIYEKYVLRDFSPIALFLFLGALLFAWGVVFGAYLWIKSIVTGHPTLTGTLMLTVLPLILGFQLLLQAIVLDIQETPK